MCGVGYIQRANNIPQGKHVRIQVVQQREEPKQKQPLLHVMHVNLLRSSTDPPQNKFQMHNRRRQRQGGCSASFNGGWPRSIIPFPEPQRGCPTFADSRLSRIG